MLQALPWLVASIGRSFKHNAVFHLVRDLSRHSKITTCSESFGVVSGTRLFHAHRGIARHR